MTIYRIVSRHWPYTSRNISSMPSHVVAPTCPVEVIILEAGQPEEVAAFVVRMNWRVDDTV